MPSDMPATPKSTRKGNGLALLAYKCASRTFDISSGMVYASMRDQIVRAQLLVRDLKVKDPNCNKLLIIGAGVAGISAACCANELGIKAVVLETAAKPFSLQAGVKERMVGPFMYEWPNIVAGSQDYPLDKHGLGSAIGGTPRWSALSPITAHKFSQELRKWLKGRKFKHPKPVFLYGVDPDATRAYALKFVDIVGKVKDGEPLVEPPELPIEILKTASRRLPMPGPDYVILAVGMGTEQTELVAASGVKGAKFWANDGFRKLKKMDWDVGVFGGGDGALQDVLRLITKHSHPLAFIEALEMSPIAANLVDIRPRLDSLEQQSRLLATWSTAHTYDLIDLRCKQLCAELVAKPGVIAAVRAEIRKGKGRVFHVCSSQYFGRAYLLNRFCLHLVVQCLANDKNAGVVRYVALYGTKAVSANKNSDKYEVKLNNGHAPLLFDRIAVRFGPDQEELMKEQLIQLSGETLTDRVSMSAIPLPYVVVQC